MRRVTALSAAAAIALSALAVASPSQAAPYNLIKWDGINACQIWDIATGKPTPDTYKVVSRPVATFDAALAIKNGLLARGVCKI